MLRRSKFSTYVKIFLKKLFIKEFRNLQTKNNSQWNFSWEILEKLKPLQSTDENELPFWGSNRVIWRYILIIYSTQIENSWDILRKSKETEKRKKPMKFYIWHHQICSYFADISLSSCRNISNIELLQKTLKKLKKSPEIFFAIFFLRPI